ncbi:unnamed protein product [Ilex paraguariensis]|uniref:Uncharacterized protein n=1 Tax=Ilex paraguariensis TaxID=185542 RepID=A0ABC8RBH9_9AQUA
MIGFRLLGRRVYGRRSFDKETKTVIGQVLRGNQIFKRPQAVRFDFNSLTNLFSRKRRLISCGHKPGRWKNSKEVEKKNNSLSPT